MKLVRLLMRGAPTQVTLSLVFSALGGLLSGAVVIALQYLMRDTRPTVVGAAILTVLGLSQIAVSIGARRIVLRALHEKVLIALRQDIVRSGTLAPLRDLEKLGSPVFQGALTSSIANVSHGAFALTMGARSLAAALGCTAVLAWVAPALVPFGLVVLLVGLGVFLLLSRQVTRAANATQALSDQVQHDVDGLVDGNRELRQNAARRKAFLDQALEPDVRALHAMEARASIWNAVSARWLSIPFLALIGLLLFTNLRSYTTQLNGNTYVLTLLYLQAEVITVLMQLGQLRAAEVALTNIERVKTALATPEKHGPVAQTTTKSTAPLSCSTLELSGVTVAYECEKGDLPFVLGPIELTLTPGEVVFVIGGNGSGKSTLAKVLCGLYLPESGTVRLDGKPIADDNREEFRQHFSAIFSDHHVFKELHGLTADDVEERAKDLITKLELQSKVEVKDGEFSNINLSSGQRKRLAMVTARLEDRPVIILDEWASDQDPSFREMFYRVLLPELKKAGKIVVVVSHDDRYFDAADRTLRLQDGKLVDAVVPAL